MRKVTSKTLLKIGFVVLLMAASAGPGASREIRQEPGNRLGGHPVRAQQVARGIALALGQEDLRAELRDAMRESPYREHKLVLQSFAGTEKGRRLIGAAADALGRSPEEMDRALASLPDLDFYVAYREHRTTWKATPEVLVAAAFDSRAPVLAAYDVAGNSHELRLEDGIPNTPLIVLHPAETKFRRPAEEAASRDVIEGQTRSRSRSVEALVAPGYYLYHYNIQEGDGWYGGDCEMEFRSHFRRPDGSLYNARTLTRSGVNEDQGYDFNNGELFLNASDVNHTFVLAIWEMDGSTGNDWYGTREYLLNPGTKHPIVAFYENTYQPNDPILGDRSAWIGVERR